MRNPVFPQFILLVVSLWFVTACVSSQNVILPDKYKRQSLVERYKSCVAFGTNHLYNPHSCPDEIVRRSMASCQNFRLRMVSEYPARWRENYAQKVDAELYQREIAWVLETRNKERNQ